MGINEPKVVLNVSLNDILTVEGPDAERALQYAEKFLSFFGIQGGVAIKSFPHTLPCWAGIGNAIGLSSRDGSFLSSSG